MGWGGAFIALLVLGVIGGLAFFFARWIIRIAGSIVLPASQHAIKAVAGRSARRMSPLGGQEQYHTPIEIVWFERTMIASVLLSLLLNWEMWLQLAAFGGPLVLLIGVVSHALPIGLTVAVSRRRNSIAMWFLVSQFGMCVPLLFLLGIDAPRGVLLPLGGICLALCLLFTPASRRWLKGED